MEKNKCLHCGKDEPAYCEECYQKLIALEIGHQKLNGDFRKENKLLKKMLDKIIDFIHVNDFDDEILQEYCPGAVDNCKYPKDPGCHRCIKEYFEKKVREK